MYSTSVGTVTPLQLFREAVSGAADSPAISNAQRTWTYAELDRWTDAIAHRLTAAGWRSATSSSSWQAVAPRCWPLSWP